VLAIEQLEASVGAMCLTDAAKTLGRPPREFSRALERASWVYRRDGTGELVAYQAKIKSGLLEHATFKFWTPAGERRVRSQVKVTPAGLAKLARMFGAE
jgi:phage antirepressor YoqD-like protein